MLRYSTKPRRRRYVKRYGFLFFRRNLSNKLIIQQLKNKQLIDVVAKTRKDTLKLADSQYSINKNISFENPMLRSVLCDYSNAYIVVKEIIDPDIV